MKIINIYADHKCRTFSDEYLDFREKASTLSKHFLVIKRIEDLNETFDFKIEYILNPLKSQLETIIFTDDVKYLEFLLRAK